MLICLEDSEGTLEDQAGLDEIKEVTYGNRSGTPNAVTVVLPKQ
jgi:hypothetical protein